MTAREGLWAIGLLVVGLLMLGAFRRVRRRTDDYRQSALLKQRLPLWVGQFETTAFCLLMAPALMIVVNAFFALRAGFGVADGAMTGVSVIYFALGLILIAVPLALLAANVVSWLFPPARRANLKAMEGLSVSFWTSNRGLLLFGAVSAPFGAALLVLSVLAPWR
jgi:hypothetical protein